MFYNKKITERIGTDFYSQNYQSFSQVIGSSGNKKKCEPTNNDLVARSIDIRMINIDNSDIYGPPCDCAACGGIGCGHCS
jgi:hypothetical protein